MNSSRTTLRPEYASNAGFLQILDQLASSVLCSTEIWFAMLDTGRIIKHHRMVDISCIALPLPCACSRPLVHRHLTACLAAVGHNMAPVKCYLYFYTNTPPPTSPFVYIQVSFLISMSINQLHDVDQFPYHERDND